MPTLQDQKLADLRYTTQIFINEDPTPIALLPSRGGQATRTASGGHHYSGATARPLQTFRISARSSGGGYERSADGNHAIKFEYDLIGTFDAQVEIGDTWEETAPDGSQIHYSVDYVHPANGYNTTALVTAFATQPQHGDA